MLASSVKRFARIFCPWLRAVLCAACGFFLTASSSLPLLAFAVDVAEITVKRFGAGVRVASVKIDTEQMVSQEGGNRNVSTIEIELTATPVAHGIAEEPTPILTSQP